MQKGNNLVTRFIKHFQNEGTIKTFTEGCCYYFALILKERFGGDIMYDEVDNHFACLIGSKVYDVTGEVIGNFIDWDSYKRMEPLNAQRVIRDCITKN